MKQRNHTLLFIGVFILAGVMHICENYSHNVPSPDYSVVTAFFSLVFITYTALLIFWIRSVYTRLLPSRVRVYMITMVLFMMLYLVERIFKYRVAADALSLRLFWYAYYIPMTLFPTFFLMICICILRGNRATRYNEFLFLIPAVLLSSIIITNDLHHLVFRPKEKSPAFIGQSGTYTYGLLFYLTYAWIILAIIVGVVLLIKAVGRRNKEVLLYIIGVGILWFFLTELHSLKKVVEFIPPYESPEINIFSMLAICEICIRGGLIPHNENYIGFFSKLPLPVLITDRDFKPVYRSAEEISADRQQLAGALETPVYATPNQKLSGRRIHGGYAFWIEDEAQVRRANEKLAEVNDLLASENTLIEYENRQKEQNALLRSRHHIYHEIAEQMYPYQKRIEEIVSKARPGTKDFREQVSRVCVLNAFVKRKTNLLLLASEKKELPLKELLLAVSESGSYLTYNGMQTSVYESGFNGSIEADQMSALYDTFEAVVEKLIGHATLLMVSYDDSCLRLAADAAPEPDLDGLELPVEAVKSEGILYINIPAGKDGD